ncbi:coat protein, partial [Trifolium medium]|nr:coat protein [Trifolium medium]
MDCAGLLSPGSEIWTLLNGFRTQYSLTDVYIPGPLVQCFKNISCFSPSATDRFGNVSPSIPARLRWNQESRLPLPPPRPPHYSSSSHILICFSTLIDLH